MATITSSQVILVEERPNPSSDFFVLPCLARLGATVQRCRFNQLPDAAALTGKTIIFVRYVPKCWRELVQQAKGVAQVILFVDDDVLDPSASVGMPWRYRLKLWRWCYQAQGWLKAQRATLWVANAYLAQKYQHWQPDIIAAMPLNLAQSAPVTLFYHGSSSHQAEARWLFPVVAEALKQVPQLTFEIIADKKIARLYRSLDRCHVLHPMSWPGYQALLARQRYDIGLAPLLPLPFNQARSVTKFFDITQAGAVGIFADSPIYQAVAASGSGICLPMQAQQWLDAIVMLANDSARRKALLHQAHISLANWSAGAEDGC